MIVHLHCVCWNDIDMLHYFFRNYDEMVSHYFVDDDGSDDGTLDYLAQHSNVTVRQKPRINPDSYVLESHASHQTSWLRSRGIADWVLVVDIDEHIYHPDLSGYLQAQTEAGVTAIPALGFQMLAHESPPPEVRLSDHLRRGAPWAQMSKLVLFSPDAVTNPGFAVGRHSAEPAGAVRYPERDELLLLHYKYLELKAVSRRHAAEQARRRKLDLEHDWGHRYAFDKAQLAADFASFEARAIDIADMPVPHDQHHEPRWWRPEAASLTDSIAPLRQDSANRRRASDVLSRLHRLLRLRR